MLRFIIALAFFSGIHHYSFGQNAAETNKRPDTTISRAHYPVLFSAAFNKQRDLRQWTMRPARRHCRLVRDSAGNRVLRIASSEAGTELLQKSLPVAAVAGRKLLIRMRVRNAGISTPPASYNGVKVAMRISSPAGEDYPQLGMPVQAFGWQDAGFTTVIPKSATSCTLMLGLEAVSGEVLFDDVTIRIFPQATEDTAVFLIASLTQRLRGAMIPTFATPDDLRTLASWGANHVRWQLTWNGFPQSPADTATLSAYRHWLTDALEHVQHLMPLCDSLGLKVLIDLHTLPGGRNNHLSGEHRLFTDTAAQAAFRAIWKDIATRFRAEPALWGYDLANEPAEGLLPDGIMDWQSLAAVAASDIRTIDTVHRVIIEGAPGGGPLALQGLQPVSGAGSIAYSLHMYEPGLFTHQGIYGLDTGVRYPGVIGGRYWDKDTLRRLLQPVREWQLRHGVEIYVGEFGAVRWAPGVSAYNYLRDCIDLFEAWGWSWAYHAFREWDGWSVEHSGVYSDHEKSLQPTDRQLLLMEAFGKNRRLTR